MRAISSAIYPDANRGRSMGVERSRPIPTPGRTPAALFITLLFTLVALILLIACTNIGGMLLARGMARAKDVSLRLALGANRARVVRLLVTESLVLSCAGALVGIGLAVFLIQLLRAIVTDAPAAHRCRLAAGLARRDVLRHPGDRHRTALWPVARARCVEERPRLHLPIGRLNAGATPIAIASRVRRRADGDVVLLLVTALLLGRSLHQAGVIDPGFRADDVDAMRLDLQLGGYSNEVGQAFTADLLARMAQIPGVNAVSTARGVPLTLAGFGLGPIRPPGQAFDVRSAIFPDWGIVSPDYFETLRIPILSGRAFDESDGASSDVIIVNETLARRLFPGEDAVGRAVLHQSGPPPGQSRPLRIVGVARDGKYRSLGEEPRAFVYAPAAQAPSAQFWVLARTSGSAVLARMQIDPQNHRIRICRFFRLAGSPTSPRSIYCPSASPSGSRAVSERSRCCWR